MAITTIYNLTYVRVTERAGFFLGGRVREGGYDPSDRFSGKSSAWARKKNGEIEKLILHQAGP